MRVAESLSESKVEAGGIGGQRECGPGLTAALGALVRGCDTTLWLLLFIITVICRSSSVVHGGERP